MIDRWFYDNFHWFAPVVSLLALGALIGALIALLNRLLHGIHKGRMGSGAIMVLACHLDELPKHRGALPAFKGRELGALPRQVRR